MSTNQSATIPTSLVTAAWTSSRSAWLPSLVCGVVSMAVAVDVARVCGAGAAATGWAGVMCALLACAGVMVDGRVMCTVNAREVGYRCGPGRWRRIPVGSIRRAENRQVGPLAIVGTGVPGHRQQARHIIGAGHVLHLELTTGEHVWLSTTGALPDGFLPTA